MGRLAGCLSPYLLQHADNPVDWHPWGGEALDLARSESRPILLSIGYAACHWCHVMAHESFEDEQTARAMNENFVNIKLDREERPDIDHIYQVAHQLMSGRSGGWPLTVFMTPEQVPFFIGTYFPPAPGRGMPSFGQVLGAMAQAWRNRRKDIELQNESVMRALHAIETQDSSAAPLDEALLAAGAKQAAAGIDPVKGGYGGAPKFAHPVALRLCLSFSSSRNDGSMLKNITNTLHKMGDGGLFDHVGGGFFRYCVDEDWRIPHFEKMLYDNGLLLSLYSQAHEITGDPSFRERIEMTAEWALREMRGAEGEFFCSLDADSEGREGAFYAWTGDEVADVLDRRGLEVARAAFGLDAPPNFEERHHLSLAGNIAECARKLGVDEDEFARRLAAARGKLFAARKRRPRPGLDDKALASWNALMISGLFAAGRALGDERYVRGAVGALDFVRRKMLDDSGLRAAYRNGVAYLDGYLSDYAFVLQSALDALDFPDAPDWVAPMARRLAEKIISAFGDDSRGGFYFTSDSHERLILRTRTGMDDVMPSGNAVAASALHRAGRGLDDSRFGDAALKCLEGFSGNMRDYPKGMAGMLAALMERIDGG